MVAQRGNDQLEIAVVVYIGNEFQNAKIKIKLTLFKKWNKNVLLLKDARLFQSCYSDSATAQSPDEEKIILACCCR